MYCKCNKRMGVVYIRVKTETDRIKAYLFKDQQILKGHVIMNTSTGKAERISGVKRCILFILVVTMITACFSTALAPQADAASYKVKSWKSGDWYCYTVYTGNLPKEYCADFYRFDSDIYKSEKTKITFFNTCNDVSAAQVDYFWRWLGQNSKANSWYAGYFEYYSYFPYLITGWTSSTDLCSKSPFTNSAGTSLFVDFLGYGNQTGSMWATLVDGGDYAMLKYFSEENVTVGLRFEDAYANPIDPYFAWVADLAG